MFVSQKRCTSWGTRAWNPSACNVRLIVWTETSMPVAAKSFCSSLAVTRGFFSICLLKNLLAVDDNFFRRPRPGNIANVPLALCFRTMLPTVSLLMFSLFAIVLYPSPWLWRKITSFLNLWESSLDFTTLATTLRVSVYTFVCRNAFDTSTDTPYP